MSQKSKKLLFSSIITIFLFIPILSIPFYYAGLVEVEFFSPNLNFENPDEENLLLNHSNKLKGVGPIVFSVISLFQNTVIQEIGYFPFMKLPFCQQKEILQC